MGSADLRGFLVEVRKRVEGRGIPIPDVGFGIVADDFFATVCEVLGKVPDTRTRDGYSHSSVWGAYYGVRISAMTAPRRMQERNRRD